MGQATYNQSDELSLELEEWLDSLDYVLGQRTPEQVRDLLERLQIRAQQAGLRLPISAGTPYINTIPHQEQPTYPGSRELERRIKNLVRWNAMAMVTRANRAYHGIGGHISTFASSATLYEVGLNHFFKAATADTSGDQVYFQGHAAPGMYARAYLEGRLSEEQLTNFRRELQSGGGLSSYPHPWLMPDFWQFPTVSMGLGPLCAVYQARFNRYLNDRGLKDTDSSTVWAFLGDGETDEPEATAAIALAGREKLDNVIFVVNCNLQRLDGPVRGNGKIIQELEGLFRGANWNVLKVIWGDDWDPLLDEDHDGVLVERMGQVVDGEYQKYSVESGSYIRDHFFGTNSRLGKIAKNLSDEQLTKLRRGGHDPQKVYAAYRAATEHKGAPTVVLAKTIKGYGLGEAGEGRNIAHNQKELNFAEVRSFRTRFGIPISDNDVDTAPFYRPPMDSPEMQYLRERREALGGYLPARRVEVEPLKAPSAKFFDEFYQGSKEREISTTMALTRVVTLLLRDKQFGPLIVPIIPDEARTFGMESLFSQVGIYSHLGQLYEPVDKGALQYYKEATNGQVLQEGITEAGSMSSFIAAGTAYATHGINTIPFYIFYSMFGHQRVGDQMWLAGDIRCKGFLVGGTAGRTTLSGEGLQHEDGNSHLFAYPLPNLIAYDPAFAYEIAVIVRDGIRRMYENQEDVFYYLTVENENYVMPPMPDGEAVEEGILKGMYRFKRTEKKRPKLKAHLCGSGAILNAAIEAQSILEERFDVATDVWSITSFKALHRDGLETDRHNRLHPVEGLRTSYIEECFATETGTVVIASDYVKALPESIARWFPGKPATLGTDGFGRSESREALRDFFEVDARHIALAALSGLAQDGDLKPGAVDQAIKELDIDPTKADPVGR